MPRLFLALPVPAAVAEPLALLAGGIPGARWQPAEKLHLTIRFIGDVDAGAMRRLEGALPPIPVPAFDLALGGMGLFPPRGAPRALWIGVAPPEPAELAKLHTYTGRVLARLGLPADRRAFAPHVTLARLRRSPIPAVMDFVARNALLRPPPFPATHLNLYSSVLARSGSRYRVEAAFPLETQAG